MPLLFKFKDKIFYGWIIVSTLLIILTILSGIRFSFGIFFKSIEVEFALSRAATSAILSAYLLLGCVFSILGGWFSDRYGPRNVILHMGLLTGLSLLLTSQTNSTWQLFITYSFLLSMGTSSLYVINVSVASRWFDKRRGLALGILTSGAGFGLIFVPQFAAYLISNFDWRTAYIIMGMTGWLIVIPLSRLLRRSPDEIGALPDGAKSDSIDVHAPKLRGEDSIQPRALSLSQVIKTRSFYLFLFTYSFFAANVFLVLTHLVPHATDIGISAGEAASILGVIGATRVASTPLFGIIADRIGRKSTGIICILLQAMAMLWLLWAHELWTFYLFAVAYGLSWSIPAVLGALIGDTFGVSRIGSIVGMLDIGFGIGAATGPAIGGLIFDASNSYSVAFLLGAIGMLTAAFLIAAVRQET